MTRSNPHGTAYYHADPNPHQTVKFSNEVHREQKEGFTIHIYTDANGVYDRSVNTSWDNSSWYTESENAAVDLGRLDRGIWNEEQATSVAEKQIHGNEPHEQES